MRSFPSLSGAFHAALTSQDYHNPFLTEPLSSTDKTIITCLLGYILFFSIYPLVVARYGYTFYSHRNNNVIRAVLEQLEEGDRLKGGPGPVEVQNPLSISGNDYSPLPLRTRRGGEGEGGVRRGGGGGGARDHLCETSSDEDDDIDSLDGYDPSQSNQYRNNRSNNTHDDYEGGGLQLGRLGGRGDIEMAMGIDSRSRSWRVGGGGVEGGNGNGNGNSSGVSSSRHHHVLSQGGALWGPWRERGERGGGEKRGEGRGGGGGGVSKRERQGREEERDIDREEGDADSPSGSVKTV